LEAFVVVLLSMATNLESLNVHWSVTRPEWERDGFEIIQFLAECAVRPRNTGDVESRQRFAQLRTVRFAEKPRECLTHWVNLPSLRSLEGSVYNTGPLLSGSTGLQYSGITQLDVLFVNLSTSEL